MTATKVLVVGGAGYVGSVLAAELLERGYRVKVLDRLYYGDTGLKEVKDRIELIVADMRAIDPTALKDVDAVINVGGLSNDPTAEYSPAANHEMNTVASVGLASMCKERGVRRYIFASSASVYDRGVGREETDVLLSEDAEVNPVAAYSRSKFDAEGPILAMADDSFCPTVLRKGTIFGFSPRLRYDLVVNTLVKDALATGAFTVYYGGEMWRPLLEVRDAARAYVAVLQADEARVRGQVFNVAFRNLRVSEVALRVQRALAEVGVKADLRVDYSYRGVRSYRMSSSKIERTLGFRPLITIEESTRDLVHKISAYHYTDFDNPKYYNIRWMQCLEDAQRVISVTGSVLETPLRYPLPATMPAGGLLAPMNGKEP